MITLIGVEFYKLRTTRLLAGLTLAATALVGLATVLMLALGDQLGDGEVGTIASEADLRSAVDVSTIAALFGLVLGATAIPGEIRYRTMTPSVLATPKRSRVVLAKAVAYAIAGAALAIVVEVGALAVISGWRFATGESVPFGWSVVAVLALAPIVTGAVTAIGVGVGAAIPSQLGSVLVALGWAMVVEQLLSGLIDGVGPWLPVSGAAAAVAAADPEPSRPIAFLVVLLYCLIIGAIGIVATERRDIV
jgi:ABC-type transport system involved in multi-copper enzyme maturation permease subunit